MTDRNHPPPSPDPAPFEAFTDLTRRLLAVPKPEIDRAEAEYQKGREGKLKPGPKPKGD